MIQIILCFLFAVVLIPITLFLGAFLFLVVMTFVSAPFFALDSLFRRK